MQIGANDPMVRVHANQSKGPRKPLLTEYLARPKRVRL